MEKRISYLNRTYQDYKDALIEYSKKYYPDVNVSYNDASIMSWLIDMVASVADSESYHIDRVYQETSIDSAQELGSVYAIARNNGVKIPGPKGSMCEVRISVSIPVGENGPDLANYAPIVKRGTRFASSSQSFELMYDVDFLSPVDAFLQSDRTIIPNRDGSMRITGYTVTKLATVTAGETKVYRQVLKASDIEPFMEVVLPVENVMNVESILILDGTDNDISPSYGAFYSEENCVNRIRYYEVDNLAQSMRWGDVYDSIDGKPVTYTYGYPISGAVVPTYCITRGEWKPVEHKFITEYTDKGYLKIIFGAGVNGGNVEIGDNASQFAKWQISRMMNNKNLGLLPDANTTMFILYRTGGGLASNVPEGAITRITSLNASFRGPSSANAAIMASLAVTNTTSSISGKDMPTVKEMKYLIKYHTAAQERCVTVKDYIDRILLLPPKYGTPFRVGVAEENNKIMIYLLGIDSDGKLDKKLPRALILNIEDYLSEYRMINDCVEIKPGRVINLSFEVNLIVDKNYNTQDVLNRVHETIVQYMDVNGSNMGENVYVSDLEKEIVKTDGVISLISLNVYNEYGENYSKDRISQETSEEEVYTETNSDSSTSRDLIDLDATYGMIVAESDTMFEVKYPDEDIIFTVMER